MLCGGCGFMPIWPKTWQFHFMPATACPKGRSRSGMEMGVLLAAPLGQRFHPGLRDCPGPPLSMAGPGAKTTHDPGVEGEQLHKGSFSCLGRQWLWIEGDVPTFYHPGRVWGGHMGVPGWGRTHPDISLLLCPRGTLRPASRQPCQPHG